MRRKTKKIAAAILAAAMLMTSISGCGSKDETQTASQQQDSKEKTGEDSKETNDDQGAEGAGGDISFDEHMDISIALWDIETMMDNAEDDALFKHITDKFNITIEPVNITWDDYTQKIQVWAASGSLPDVFTIDAIGTSSYQNWTTQGIVRPLMSLDENKYPNLSEYFKTKDIAALADAEGKFYCVPRRMFDTVDWSVLDRVVAYRWDLAQEAGVTKEPETWDEFKEMLKAIVENDPRNMNVAGLTSTTTKMIGGLFWLYSNPIATSDGSGSDFKWIKEDDKYVPAVFSEKALPSLENMRNMYTDGLIDPDIALTNVNSAYDKFVTGNVAACLMGGGFLNLDGAIYSQRWAKANPDDNFTDCVKVLKPLKGLDGEYNHAVFKTYWSESYFSSSVDDAKMERIMALYDYLVSEEGRTLLDYGFEGEDYKVENGKIVPITENIGEKYKAKGIFNNLASYDNNTAYSMDSNKIVDEDIRKEAVDYINWVLDNTKIPEYYPELTTLSTPTKDGFTVLDHDDLLNIMMGTKPVEDMWNEILEQYEAKGLSKMIEEVNQEAGSLGLN